MSKKATRNFINPVLSITTYSLIHQWTANKIKPNKSTSEKKKRKIHLALGSALDPAQVYKIKTSVHLQHFLFVSGVNRLQHKSSL